MKFRVKGCEKSGQSVTLTIEAADARSAATVASNRGIVVEVIEREPLDYDEPPPGYADVIRSESVAEQLKQTSNRLNRASSNLVRVGIGLVFGSIVVLMLLWLFIFIIGGLSR